MVVTCQRALVVGVGQMVVLAQLHDNDEARGHDPVQLNERLHGQAANRVKLAATQLKKAAWISRS